MEWRNGQHMNVVIPRLQCSRLTNNHQRVATSCPAGVHQSAFSDLVQEKHGRPPARWAAHNFIFKQGSFLLQEGMNSLCLWTFYSIRRNSYLSVLVGSGGAGVVIIFTVWLCFSFVLFKEDMNHKFHSFFQRHAKVLLVLRKE